jgi:hypothetical protein
MTTVQRTTARHGFTLIELMISVTLAMLMSTMAILAFFKIHNLVTRSESRVAMHSDAEIIFSSLRRQLASTMQHCALVVRSTAATTGAYPATGKVALIFMHGKEDSDNFEQFDSSFPYNNTDGRGNDINSDLVWEEWSWNQATNTLSAGSSSNLRKFVVTRNYTPPGGTADLQSTQWWQDFDNLPQPRRWLDPAHPEYTLDDNRYFPPAGDPTYATSQASPGDVGDWSDLQNNLRPIQSQVTDFSLQVVFHDGRDVHPLTVDDTTTATTVFSGVYMDGRMPAPGAPAGPTGQPQWPSCLPGAAPPGQADLSLTAPQATPAQFPSTAIANRPKLIRVRFTLMDPRTASVSNRQINNAVRAGNAALAATLIAAQQKSALSLTFSFSFPLPGMAPPP